MESVCECVFNDLIHNNILNSTLKYSESLNNIYNLIKESNIDVLVCFKNIFNYKFFIKNYGGFFILSLIFIQIICTIIYSFLGTKKIKNYILNATNQYINSNLYKKEKKTIIIRKRKIYFSDKNSMNNKTKKVVKNEKTVKSPFFNSSTHKLDKKIINSNKTSNKKTLTIDLLSKDELNNLNLNEKIKKNINNEEVSKININEYLSTNTDDMDFEDILEKDKRKFLEYFLHSIKEKHLFVNTFFTNNNIKPKSIKIIIFILTITFHFLFNGLYYTEMYIIKLYYIKEDEPLFGFVERTYERLFYTSFITFIINIMIDCFIKDEKKIKGIFIRGKNKSQIEIQK